MGDVSAFGLLLKRYRRAAGLTQEELAERARLSVGGITDLERGARRRPRADTVQALADALRLGVAERERFVAVARGPAPEGGDTTAGPARGPEGGGPPALVGRARELALLDRHLAGDGPPLLLLAGEPGIGKSRLLDEAARRGAAAGWRVLRAGCARRGGALAYTPLLQALQRHIGGQTLAHRRAALRGCAWLVRLLPELIEGPIEPLPPWAVVPEQERRLLFAAVERFLANVAGSAGTLLLLDDLQWAGADALDLLATLARTPGAPLRLVGAYRDTEVDAHEPLAGTLADLAGAGLARRHLLQPLAAAEVGHLLDLLLDGYGGDRAALAARVAARSGGVPFVVVSWAQALCAGTADEEEALPWAVAQGLWQRLAAVPALAREALGAAAIAAGRTVSVPVLAAVLAQPECAVLEALEAAWRARLLVEADGGYRLAHDLIREVLEADLGPGRRAYLHRRTAEVLAGRPGGAPAPVLAYHFGRSDAPERAVGYLEQAGDQAQVQHGRSAAESFYREAMERLDGLGRAREAARVREKLGSVLQTGARYAEALATLEPAADLQRAAGDPEAAGRVEAEIALVHVRAGTAVKGLARVQPVLASLAARGPSAALAAVYAAQADLLVALGRPLGAVLAASERAECVARIVGDNRPLAHALQLRLSALLYLGRLEEAAAVGRAASAVAEAAGFWYVLCWVQFNLGIVHLESGAFAAARQVIERALHLAERHGFRSCTIAATYQRGWISLLAGTWEAARHDLEEAAALSRAIGPGSICSLLMLASLCMTEGAEAQAARYLEEAELLLPPPQRGRCWPLARVLAVRDLLAGRPEAARAHLVPLLEPGGMEGDTTPVRVLLAWTLLSLGDMGAAAESAQGAVARARDRHQLVLLVDALRVDARVAARYGRLEEAEDLLQEALQLTRTVGHPFAEAQVLQDAGHLCARRGRPELARERWEAAQALLRQVGARPDANASPACSPLGIRAHNIFLVIEEAGLPATPPSAVA